MRECTEEEAAVLNEHGAWARGQALRWCRRRRCDVAFRREAAARADEVLWLCSRSWEGKSGNFRGYVASALRNALSDLVAERTGKRTAAAPGLVVESDLTRADWITFVDAPDGQIRDVGQGTEQRELARRLLDVLTPRDREVLVRLIVNGEDPAAVARRFRISVPRLYALRKRGLRVAREMAERLGAVAVN